VLYRSIGRADRAYELLSKSIAIYEKSGIPALKKLLARNYIYAIDLYTLGGRFAEAAECIRRAEGYFNLPEQRVKISDEDERNFRHIYVSFLLGRISYSVKSGAADSTESFFEEAESISEDDGDFSSLARLWLLRADLAGKKGSRELEFESLFRAVEFAGETEDRLLKGVTCHRLAFVIDSLSSDGVYDGEESAAYLKEALDNFSFIADTFTISSEYLHYYSILSKSYERYIDHMVMKEEYEYALYYSEMIRSRRLRNQMALKEVDPDSLIAPEYKEEIKRLCETRDYLVRSYMKLSSDIFTEDAVLDRLLKKIDYMNSEIKDKRGEAEMLSPGYRVARVNPVELSEAQRFLDEKQALVVYHARDNMTVYRWVVTEDGLQFKKIFLTGSLTGMVDEMRRHIGWGCYGNYYTAGAHETGSFLYTALLKDLVEDGKYNEFHFIIAPPYTMELVPFDALVTGFDNKGKPQYLIDKGYIISLTPSLTVFAMKRGREEKDYKEDFIGFADPYYGFKARQLYQSIRETRRISDFFKKQKVYTGADAKESIFKKLPLSDYRYVHVSTHGDFLEKTLKEPVILFCLEGDPGEDGYLFASEVYNMKINSGLISFSACNTALGKKEEYEGVTGFTHAFFTAGVSEVLLTLWPVDANSAEMLFIEFYKNCSRGESPAVALNNARKNVKKRYPSPYHWGAVIHQF